MIGIDSYVLLISIKILTTMHYSQPFIHTRGSSFATILESPA